MKIRSDLMKIAKNLHTWVGVSAGILLFICFFAGGLSMFQHQISQWATPEKQQLPHIQVHQYGQLIQQVQEKYPATANSFTLNFNSNEYHFAPLSWSEKSRGEGFNTAQNTWLASLSEQGELIVQQENLAKAGWLIEQLHETAGIPGMLGHHAFGVYVMGIVAVLYFLALMSGLIILLPTLIKDYFVIRPGKNKKRFWLDTHNVVGITSLPFHILISASVIVFAFHDLFYDALGALALKGKPVFSPPAKEVIHISHHKIDIQQILNKIHQTAPEYRVDYIQFSNLDQPQKAAARIALYSPDQMLRGASQDFMRMNPYAVEKLDASGINTQNGTSEKLVNAMFSLHFGSFGGFTVRWLYLILGIGGAFLFYSGNMLWVETRARKQKRAQDPIPTQRKDVVFLANLTIGTCLGCILAIVATLMLSRIIFQYVVLNSSNHFFMYGYYLIFLACIVFTFIKGYAKALPILLMTIAMCLMLMPLTSLIGTYIPSSGISVYGGTTFWIDFVALVAAWAFFRFYQQAKDRQQNTEQGSLWAVTSQK
ncbi:PepSY-associated TM helix domain-containing protein [Acinetobacter sp. 251-1]|uniref:PepSY-associated TM helix domain-containing protein n=1 Tax=Acinetobacter sp. 251-1 TaxID=2746720 RepID=UPI002575410D|nr:PepSY-associated TM helix domain-containing protein [Acinetobacter sp. 251-1]MDM1759303.1 PepSY domain-containing protein [Acinetobacter sp. 251-1]